jgi:hypothetical protein
MAVYMIGYELHEGEDYEGGLIKAILRDWRGFWLFGTCIRLSTPH